VLEQLGIPSGTALRLARLFGNSAQFRMDLQTRDAREMAFEASSEGIHRGIRSHAAWKEKAQGNT
jgi:plasmid maintenance system antidote protein VapI